jgi:hypothetical protein
LSRIAALGTLSRPLGEARAAALARAIAGSVIDEVNNGGDPEATLDAWINRIAREIAASEAASTTPRRGIRKLAELLPEVS